ncbi:hypothetical protein D3C75_708630 [compost metagenome]
MTDRMKVLKSAGAASELIFACFFVLGRLQPALYAILIFAFSMIVFPYYEGGDQEHYRGFYDAVSGMPLSEAYDYYASALGSREPVYFFLVYGFSPYLEKDFLFSLINALLAFVVVSWVVSNRVRFYIVPLVVFNFYALVLFFPAERLKLAVLLFMIGCFWRGWVRYFFWGGAIFSHTQTILLVLSAQSRRVISLFVSLMRGKVDGGGVFLVLIAVLLCVFVFFMRGHIFDKLEFYMEFGGVGAVIKPLILSGLTAYCASGRRLESLISSLPLVVVSFFVGDERIVIFSYFVFLYFALNRNRGANIPVVLTGGYFLLKGVFFLIGIIEYGDGFAELVF